MSSVHEQTVRQHFVLVLPELDAENLDLHADMVDHYGLTSLNKVLLLMALFDALKVSLATFTEDDLARLRTLSDVMTAIHARSAPTTAAAS